MPAEFEPVQLPGDQQRLVDFLCGDVWPFHGRVRPTPDDIMSTDYSSPNAVSFWIVDCGDTVGLVHVFDLADIGRGAPMFDLRIAERHRGRGLGKQATRWITDHLFTTHDELHRIEANTRSDNKAMQRVLADVGYAHEGTLRESWWVEGGPWLDTMVFGFLRSDRQVLRPQGT